MRNLAKAGDQNNRLTLVKLHEKKRGAHTWLASCECGGETICSVRDFRSGHTKSCGCLRKEVMTKAKTTHGMTYTAEYRTWCKILGRCNNPTDHKFSIYGGRGIKVCDRWNSFVNFYKDMGDRPSDSHSIDRINVNGNYEPNNCRWATVFEQAQNRRNNVLVMLDGCLIVVAEAERRLGIHVGSITQRCNDFSCTHQEASDHFANKKQMIGGVQ